MLCSSSFADMMENYSHQHQHQQQQQQQQGDLADIVRAGGGGGGTSSGLSLSDDDSWLQFPSDNIITLNDDDFGDPFSNNFRHPSSSSSSLFNNNDINHDHHSTSTSSSSSSTASFFTNNNPHGFLAAAAAAGGGFRPPSNNNNNIFSRMLQISPSVSPSCELANPTVVTGGLLLKVASSNLVENGVSAAGVQISSPRNAGIKRRKSQAKKVVCIPAPTPANSRPSGEVVPSDLWAWRKYGQKPIKGSPYPRGYYRCSSSKGCSARKQVERSRTDPNMLVITYTSEHNHPWPTQRNALAGSTRAQPNKAGSGSGSKSSNTGSQTHKAVSNDTNELEDEKDKPNFSLENPLFDNSLVKEENMDEQMDMEGCGDVFGSEGFDLHTTYKPALHDSGHCEDLFADLGEIETDSLSLLFSQGFDQDRDGGNKGNMLDHFFDWAGNINNKQP